MIIILACQMLYQIAHFQIDWGISAPNRGLWLQGSTEVEPGGSFWLAAITLSSFRTLFDLVLVQKV